MPKMRPQMPTNQPGGPMGSVNNAFRPYPGLGLGGYPGMPYGPMVNPYFMPAYPAYLQAAPMTATIPAYQAPPTSATPSATSAAEASLGTEQKGPVVRTPPPPPEATNRMRYVSLTVAGIKNTADGDKLEATLNKMKEVRGVSVKRTGDGAATVKVWYSDRDPVKAETLVEASTKLGFHTVVAEAN